MCIRDRPTLIQWDVPAYPGISLPRQPLTLRALSGSHPHAALLRQGLAWMGAVSYIHLSTSIRFSSKRSRLVAGSTS